MTPSADGKEFIDLWSLGFIFAVSKIDTNIGRLKVEHIIKSQTGEPKQVTPLKMV